MSEPKGDPVALACDALLGRPQAALNLIHTNNCSNPASMRVPGRFGPAIRVVRKALWAPVNLVPHLPGGPLRYLWLVRLVTTIDTPLRRALHGRPLYAKSTQ